MWGIEKGRGGVGGQDEAVPGQKSYTRPDLLGRLGKVVPVAPH
jgi:hypothetical protein